MQQRQTIHRPVTLSRKKIITLSTVGVAVALAASGGIALAGRDTADASGTSEEHSVRADVKVDNNQSATSGSVTRTNDQTSSEGQASAGDDVQSPNVSNVSNSTTTITVNGQTTTVNGNASVDKSYTTDNGDGSISHVDISVHNNSSSTSSDVGEDDDME